MLAAVLVEPEDQDLEQVAQALHTKTSELERNNVEKIDALYKVMVHFAKGGAEDDAASAAEERDEDDAEGDAAKPAPRVDIQQIIDRYFAHYDAGDDEEENSEAVDGQAPSAPAPAGTGERPRSRTETTAAQAPALAACKPPDAKQLRAALLGDIRAFVRSRDREISADGKEGLTGRAIARIFHGLTSPQYPAYEWSRDTYWGRHNTADFQLILSLADKAVEALRRQRARSAAAAAALAQERAAAAQRPRPPTASGEQILVADSEEESGEEEEEQPQGQQQDEHGGGGEEMAVGEDAELACEVQVQTKDEDEEEDDDDADEEEEEEEGYESEEL